MDAHDYPANPYTSDDAIMRAKSLLLVGKVPALMQYGACVHGIDEHGDLHRCFTEQVHVTSVHVIIPPEHIHECIRLLGTDSEILSQHHETLVIRWRGGITYTVTFALLESLYEDPHPTIEQIFLYEYRSEPTWGVFYRSIELPDIFAALDHLYTKQYIIAHGHAHGHGHGHGPNSHTTHGNAKYFLMRMWKYIDKGFQPSSSAQTQQFIRSKISAACSLATYMTPLLRRSIDAFYDEIPPATSYQRPKNRGDSTYFISQLIHAHTSVPVLLASNSIAKAFQVALRYQREHIPACIAAANAHPYALGFAFQELAPEIIPYLSQLNVTWTQSDIVQMCMRGCGATMLGYQLCDRVVDIAFIHEHSPADQYIHDIVHIGNKNAIMHHTTRLQTYPACALDIVAAIGRHPHLTWLALNAQPHVFMEYIRGCKSPRTLLVETPHGSSDLITVLQQIRFAVHQHLFMIAYPTL